MNSNLKYLLLLFSFLLFLPSISLAITCTECNAESCSCTITECKSGTFNTYSSSDCSGIPNAELFFKEGKISWKPGEVTTYYTMTFCDDRITKSSCIPLTVAGTKSVVTTTTTASYEIIELNPFLVGVLIVAAIVIVGIIIIVIYSYT